MIRPPAILGALAFVVLPSCGTVGFYAQAVRGQSAIQRQARPIPEVIEQGALPATTLAKLAKVPEMLNFAESSLGLPNNGSYTHYTDLGRPHVVWVVFAAEEFSIDPRRWWYPFIGSLAYRGYFSEAPARKLAGRLGAEGLETYTGGVDAYSTLGMFRDPVLSSFIVHPEIQVAELIFHELTHQRLYLAGDTEFNEALATAYAAHGVRRWLAARGQSSEMKRYMAEGRAQRAFISLALETRARLAASYSETEGAPLEVRRTAKQAVLNDFRRRALRLPDHYPLLAQVEKFFEEPVTNARLATVATYYDLVPGFEAILARHPTDPTAFFKEVQSLARLPKSQRHQRLRFMTLPQQGPKIPPIMASPHPWPRD